jgi:hypothetical protein
MQVCSRGRWFGAAGGHPGVCTWPARRRRRCPPAQPGSWLAAGLSRVGPIVEQPLAEIQEIMAANFFGAVRVTQVGRACAPAGSRRACHSRPAAAAPALALPPPPGVLLGLAALHQRRCAAACATIQSRRPDRCALCALPSGCGPAGGCAAHDASAGRPRRHDWLGGQHAGQPLWRRLLGCARRVRCLPPRLPPRLPLRSYAAVTPRLAEVEGRQRSRSGTGGGRPWAVSSNQVACASSSPGPLDFSLQPAPPPQPFNLTQANPLSYARSALSPPTPPPPHPPTHHPHPCSLQGRPAGAQ